MIHSPQDLQLSQPTIVIFHGLLPNNFDGPLAPRNTIDAPEDTTVSALAKLRLKNILLIDVLFLEPDETFPSKLELFSTDWLFYPEFLLFMWLFCPSVVFLRGFRLSSLYFLQGVLSSLFILRHNVFLEKTLCRLDTTFCVFYHGICFDLCAVFDGLFLILLGCDDVSQLFQYWIAPTRLPPANIAIVFPWGYPPVCRSSDNFCVS